MRRRKDEGGGVMRVEGARATTREGDAESRTLGKFFLRVGVDGERDAEPRSSASADNSSTASA